MLPLEDDPSSPHFKASSRAFRQTYSLITVRDCGRKYQFIAKNCYVGSSANILGFAAPSSIYILSDVTYERIDDDPWMPAKRSKMLINGDRITQIENLYYNESHPVDLPPGYSWSNM